MKTAKIYTVVNSIFYTAYGLWGALIPLGMAGAMGWTPDLLGLHQIRAISMAMAVMGLFALVAAWRGQSQKTLVLVFLGLTLAFAFGRLLGLIIDGFGPTQTYYEMGFEIIWSALAYAIYRRSF